MESPSLQQLSRRERQIMDLLFEHQTMSAQDVTDQLEDAPSYTTVRTLLRILEQKGYVKHQKSGRKYVYSTLVAPDTAKQHSLKHVLKTFFGGSITEAVASFLNNPDTQLNESDLQELEDIIAAAKKKKET